MADTRQYSHEEYARLVAKTVETIQHLSTVKGGEYAQGGDRLDNFRRGAADQGLPMESIWRTYAGKHWDAIGTYIRDILTGTSRPRSESIAGRADDMIVYLILFKAMVEEREREALSLTVDGAAALEPSTAGKWSEGPAKAELEAKAAMVPEPKSKVFKRHEYFGRADRDQAVETFVRGRPHYKYFHPATGDLEIIIKNVPSEGPSFPTDNAAANGID